MTDILCVIICINCNVFSLFMKPSISFSFEWYTSVSHRTGRFKHAGRQTLTESMREILDQTEAAVGCTEALSVQ